MMEWMWTPVSIIITATVLYFIVREKRDRAKYFVLLALMGVILIFMYLCAKIDILPAGSAVLSSLATVFFLRYAREGRYIPQKLLLGAVIMLFLFFSPAANETTVGFIAALLIGLLIGLLEYWFWGA